jgi:hypothetical protein
MRFREKSRGGKSEKENLHKGKKWLIWASERLLCSAATCCMLTNAFIFCPSDNFKRKLEGVA